MASKYHFPDLQDLESVDDGKGGEFVPLFVSKRVSASSAGDLEDPDIPEGWAPLYREQTKAVATVDVEAQEVEKGGGAPGDAAGGSQAVAEGPLAPERGMASSSTGASRTRTGSKQIQPEALRSVDPKELVRVKAQARAEGHEEGLRRGEAEGRKVFSERIEELEAMIVSLGEARELMFQRVREDLATILCIVPSKILRQAIKVQPQVIVSLVGSILEELPRQERVVVKVALEDLELIESAAPDLRRRLGGYTQVEIEPNSRLTRGSAEIEMAGGRVEATIERQLETFEERVREWLLGGEQVAPPSTQVPSSYGSAFRGEG